MASAPPPRHRCITLLENSWVPASIVLGVALGYIIPLPEDSIPPPYARISAVLGWTYFVAWSLSFYPQVYLNWRRKSVVGLSFDYQLLNLVGFGCYFAFNAALFWSPAVRLSYKNDHNGTDNAVKVNDVFFSAHALLLTAITLLQIGCYWDYPPLTARVDRIVRYAVLGSLGALGVFATIYAIVIAASGVSTWLTFVDVLAQSKVVISLVKYCPQVYMNWSRKSTVGWNIHNVLLDFTGGLLSVAQLILDCWSTNDWSGILGDPVKLFLGNISMVFDTIFMIQHYCLYRTARLQGKAGSRAGQEETLLDAAAAEENT